MRFPAKIKYRGQVRAKIYANEGGYRLYWRATVAGKRQSLFKSFRTYSEAKKEAHKVVKQLYEGSAATTLTASQASDAVAALQWLESLYKSTGRRISLLAGISAICEATTKLGERPLSECVDSFLRNLATVKRMDMGQAIEQFIESRRLKTVPRAEGKRPEMSGNSVPLSLPPALRFSGDSANLQGPCQELRGGRIPHKPQCNCAGNRQVPRRTRHEAGRKDSCGTL